MVLIKDRGCVRVTNMADKYLDDYINERAWLDGLTSDERKAIAGTMDYMLYALHREWKNLLDELSYMIPFSWFVKR